MFDDVFYPPPAFHFRVDFLMFPSIKGYSFKEVSGIEAKMEVTTILEGGENMYEHRVPGRTTFDNLVLKRGFVDDMASPLVAWIMASMNSGFLLPIITTNIFVSLLGDSGSPIAAWSFSDCYPVRWSTGEMDSENTDSVLMEEIEFCYSSWTRIPAVAMKALTAVVGFMGDIAEKVGESKALNFVSDKISDAIDTVEDAITDGISDVADGILDGVEDAVDSFDASLGFDVDDDILETEEEEEVTEEEETEETKTEEVEDSAEEEEETDEDEESSESESSGEAEGTDNTGIGSGGGGGDEEENEEEEDEEEEDEEEEKEDDSSDDNNDQN
ncbi:MAG: phage tail protein [Bacteroidota bacterium]